MTSFLNVFDKKIIITEIKISYRIIPIKVDSV